MENETLVLARLLDMINDESVRTDITKTRMCVRINSLQIRNWRILDLTMSEVVVDDGSKMSFTEIWDALRFDPKWQTLEFWYCDAPPCEGGAVEILKLKQALVTHAKDTTAVCVAHPNDNQNKYLNLTVDTSLRLKLGDV